MRNGMVNPEVPWRKPKERFEISGSEEMESIRIVSFTRIAHAIQHAVKPFQFTLADTGESPSRSGAAAFDHAFADRLARRGQSRRGPPRSSGSGIHRR